MTAFSETAIIDYVTKFSTEFQMRSIVGDYTYSCKIQGFVTETLSVTQMQP